MLRDSLQSAEWFNALTLTERLFSLHAAQETIPNVIIDVERAKQRLQRWQSQPPFPGNSFFTQRLVMDGLSEAELLDLLGEPIAAVCGRHPALPSWLEELAHAFSHSSSDPNPLPETMHEDQMAGFFNLIEPLILRAIARVQQEVSTLAQMQEALPFDHKTVVEIFAAHLPGMLLTMLSRTLVLELNVARLQEELAGETPEERFHSFVQRLRQPEVALTLLQEYSVLARQVVTYLQQWVTFSVEFLQHLCTDWNAIRATFNSVSDPGLLTQVDGGAGDSHRGGRKVLIATFSSGFRLVYKPKSLAADAHFQELLIWLNQHGDHPLFRTLQIFDRGTYGWVECVTPYSCTSPDEVRRFYERQGEYLALFYALEATDFHSENLLAAGEHPVPIDLEALFHPRVDRNPQNQADRVADNMLNYSVLRVGLLPERVWSTDDTVGVDISGMGGAKGQLTPFDVPQWEEGGTDAMRLTRKRITMPGSENRPTLNGVEVDVLDYTEAIEAGFRRVYQLILQHRDGLLAEHGPIARFANDEVRAILRATQTYGVLLRESFHPDVLRNALERDRLFDRLWMQVEYAPHLAKVIPAEREDLLRGDIPMFVTRPNSRDLWTSTDERIVDFFAEPSMTLVHRRLQQLSDEDLTRQLWIVRASLATLAMGVESAQHPSYVLSDSQPLVDCEHLLAAARAVGDRLEALALHGEQDVTWVGLTLLNERHWSLTPLGVDLYDGLPGVALFLAYLGNLTGEERYTALAHAAVATLRAQAKQNRDFLPLIGAFSGWGGVLYTLTHLGVLWKQAALLDEAEELIGLLPKLIEKDEQLDIISGAAGCLASLLTFYRCKPSPAVLTAAIQCGDRLLSRAEPQANGSGRAIKIAGIERPLSGFSHGAAGMAGVLLELATITGEARFRATALELIAYERTLFSPEVGNWCDLRDLETLGLQTENGPVCQTTWCHGAPGIGLARLCSLAHIDDEKMYAEIDTAVQTTQARGFGHNHSLCHGDLGNLELLLQASQKLDMPSWRKELDRLTAGILASIEHDGWLCGVPLGVESPGLMTGLAGIGYGLLRLAEPKRVPSVLTLAPPVADVA